MSQLDDIHCQQKEQTMDQDKLIPATTKVITDLEALNARTESVVALKSTTDSNHALLSTSVV